MKALEKLTIKGGPSWDPDPGRATDKPTNSAIRMPSGRTGVFSLVGFPAAVAQTASWAKKTH
ncbi:MAG: hypothetical protein JSW21_04885, partial [Gammaproteobacteria bacterium]